MYLGVISALSRDFVHSHGCEKKYYVRESLGKSSGGISKPLNVRLGAVKVKVKNNYYHCTATRDVAILSSMGIS